MLDDFVWLWHRHLREQEEHFNVNRSRIMKDSRNESCFQVVSVHEKIILTLTGYGTCFVTS